MVEDEREQLEHYEIKVLHYNSSLTCLTAAAQRLHIVEVILHKWR